MKRCTKCGIEKPEEAFAMQPSRGRRRAECRECKTKSDKEWMAKRKLNPPQPKIQTKQCKRCQEVKSISEFSPANPGYFHSRCKVCEVALDHEKRREQYRNDPTGRFYRAFENAAGVMVKRCTYCHVEKPVSEFYTNSKRGKRRHGKCKECDKTLKKLLYDNNPEHYRAISRKWTYKHPEEHHARYYRWEAANKEHRTRYYREYNETHRKERHAYDRIRHSKETPEFRRLEYEKRREWRQEYGMVNKNHLRAYGRLWRQTFPEKHTDTQNRRRARQLNASRIEKIDRMAIIERDKWTCYLCGLICTPQNVTLDHVIPLFHGGSHTADNLRVACRSCNSRKGTKLPHAFLA